MRCTPLLACLLAACAGTSVRVPPASAIALDARPLMLEIARLEDARDDGGGRLQALLADDPDPAVRARAAVALGRLAWPLHGEEVTRPLERAAGLDGDVAVRAAALFALGLRGDPLAGERLAELAVEREPLVRARAVEALSKLARPDLREPVLAALEDPEPIVRLQAAHGTHRWPLEEEGAMDVDMRLAAALRTETDRDVSVYALHSLGRRKALAGRESFERFAYSNDDELRLFAVIGLRALAPDPRLLGPLVRAVTDADWRVACEAALALGAYDEGGAAVALGEATRRPSPHLRRVAWEALATRAARTQTLEGSRALFELLQPFWLQRFQFEAETSLSVRAAFLELELPLLSKLRSLGSGWSLEQIETMQARLDEVSALEQPVVLVGLARALGRIPEPFARGTLTTLAGHTDPFVAGAAIEALGRHPGADTRAVLLELLDHPENGLRLAALLALAGMATDEDLPELLELYRTTRGEIAPEVRFNTVRVAQTLTQGRPSPLAVEALSDADPFVRHVAREQFVALGLQPPAVEVPAEARSQPPVPGVDYPLYERNPRVELVTMRGTMVFELFPAEAPVHVHSLLELARRGAYDGLTFHRVVPDFVIQGGDPRGDGNGGPSWRGGSLRNEIGPRPYVRGSMGTPRNEDPDSGGGQLFVTHRRTPHLDGRYTILGELVAGEAVLDAVEVGDRILTLRPRP